MNDDIIQQEFVCPRCGGKLKEKHPNDKFVIRDKNTTVRLFCVCGYYRDEVFNPKDFKNS